MFDENPNENAINDENLQQKLPSIELEQSVSIPGTWRQNIPINDPRHLVFCQIIIIMKEKNFLTPVLYKTVTVNEKPQVQLHFLGRPIFIQLFNHSKSLKIVTQLTIMSSKLLMKNECVKVFKRLRKIREIMKMKNSIMLWKMYITGQREALK